MKLQITVLLWILQLRFHFCCDVVKHHQNKRLLATATTVLNTTNMTSEERCVMSCYYDNTGCLAVNVLTTGNVILCQMTTGLSNETDMVDDATSVLYVIEYKKCAEDPGFCQHSGTCQRTWTSARCHCTDRFQGNRCEMCADMRFKGDECDTCASGYYGDTCSYTFTSHNEQDCLDRQNLHFMTSSSPDSSYEDCKQWCANNTDCGGFTGRHGNCYFKEIGCRDDTFTLTYAVLFLKEMV